MDRQDRSTTTAVNDGDRDRVPGLSVRGRNFDDPVLGSALQPCPAIGTVGFIGTVLVDISRIPGQGVGRGESIHHGCTDLGKVTSELEHDLYSNPFAFPH